MLNPVDRRSLLRYTAGLSLAAGTVTLGGACTRKQPELDWVLRAFTPQQAWTMFKAGEVVLEAAPDLSSRLLRDLIVGIDEALASENALLRSKIQDAVLFLEWSSQFSLKFSPFSALPLSGRREALARFGESPLKVKRAVYQAVVGMLSFAYADRPDSWQHFGYDGPWVGRPVVAAEPAQAVTGAAQ